MTTHLPALGHVLHLAQEVHSLARAEGRKDLTTPLAAQAQRWTAPTGTVVLAGAQKRGKSRLLNALLEHPDLLPVDADVATDSPLTLRYAPALEIAVTVEGESGPETKGIAPADLRDHASVLGDVRARRTVLGVDVGLPAEVLHGVELVDTPGFDSLSLGHRHATAGVAATADALLFAVSASDQPVLAHELEYLAEIAERVPTIAFVLTKIDDSNRWEELLDLNRERVERFVANTPGLDPGVALRLLAAPWLHVSARGAESARADLLAGHPERAARRLRLSGMEELRAYVARCGHRREALRAAAVLELCRATLRALEGRAENLKAVGDGPEAIAEQQRSLDETEAALRARDRRRTTLAPDLTLLEQQARTIPKIVLDRFRHDYEKRIAALRPREIPGFADELEFDLGRSLECARREVAEAIRQHTERGLVAYARALDTPFQPDIVGSDLPAPDRGVELAPRMAVAPRDSLIDLVGSSSAGFLTANLGTPLLALLGVSTATFAFVPAAAGAAVAGGFFVYRRRVKNAAREQTALTRAVVEAWNDEAARLGPLAQRAVTTWQRAAVAQINQAMVAEKDEIGKRRAELATSEADRKTAASEARRRLDAARDLTMRADALRNDLVAVLARLADGTVTE